MTFIDKWYPFHISTLERCFKFNSCKCAIFKLWKKQQNQEIISTIPQPLSSVSPLSLFTNGNDRFPASIFILLLVKSIAFQGTKKIIFTACHSGKLKLAFTSPDVISTSPKSFWRAELISQFFCYLNSSKNITCPSGKLKTEFTSPVAKSTSPELSETTFFARCLHNYIWGLKKVRVPLFKQSLPVWAIIREYPTPPFRGLSAPA